MTRITQPVPKQFITCLCDGSGHTYTKTNWISEIFILFYCNSIVTVWLVPFRWVIMSFRLLLGIHERDPNANTMRPTRSIRDNLHQKTYIMALAIRFCGVNMVNPWQNTSKTCIMALAIRVFSLIFCISTYGSCHAGFRLISLICTY